MVTINNRIKHGVEIPVAVVCRDYKVGLRFIGLDGKARYSLDRSNDKLYTARELVAKCRPDLIEAYDKHNPTGVYKPYNGE